MQNVYDVMPALLFIDSSVVIKYGFEDNFM